MAIDLESLTQRRRYEDPEAGLSEEFLERRLGPGRAFGLLSAPLGERRSVGWVIVPSIGPEHGNLRRLETLIARSLAVAGFPVLRIRPDLHPVRGALGEIDLSARISEVDDAASVMAGESGVSSVGLLGVLFGGTVAAVVAERLGAPGLVLVEPVTRGKRYVRETVRRQAVAELIAAAEEQERGELVEAGPARRPLDELAAAGETTIRGLRLSQPEFERISEIDLVQSMRTFPGNSLLVGISPSGTASPAIRTLHAHLETLGGDVTLELLEDPLPAPFGEYYYRNAGPIRLDTRLELDKRITGVTTAWALDELGRSPGQAAA